MVLRWACVTEPSSWMNSGHRRPLKFSKLIAARIPASHVSDETSMCTETGVSGPARRLMQAKDERADHMTSHPGKLASRGRTNACQHEYVRRLLGEVWTRRKARSLSVRTPR